MRRRFQIRRRLRRDDHPETAETYFNLGHNLYAQGKYREAHEDGEKRRRAWTQLGSESPSPVWTAQRSNWESASALAAVLARLGQPEEAWQAARRISRTRPARRAGRAPDRRLSPAERARLLELTEEIERLDRLVETTPEGLDQAERAKRFGELKHERELAGIALGEFQSTLVKDIPACGAGRRASRNPGGTARQYGIRRLGRYPTGGTERG